MSFEEKVKQLTEQKQELEVKLKALEDKWVALDRDISEVESLKFEVEDELKNLHKDNTELGFEEWKKQQPENVLNAKPETFTLTKEQLLEVRYLESLYASTNTGAIGGGTTLNFTPTSIGDIVTVTINGKEFSLTDYSTF